MVVCAACGVENVERAKYCLECGTALDPSAQVPAREERKVVTVLFCDLVGFTATSEASDPEDVQRRLDPYHARVRAEIESFGGTVDKYIGDAVMGVFGIPAAHEDDAERAVRTGLAVLDAIEDLNAADPGGALEVRVGVNTGEALVAMSARPETGQWMVSGDVTNTASRLQSAAPVDSVVVGESTYRRTWAIFEYEQLEPVVAKGKAQPLALWRAKAARARFGTDITRDHRSPFVGRDLEKPLLIGTFERAAQAGSVQLVTIVGEPGVGKTRLVAELFAYIDAKPELIRWRQGRCLPYGEGITFWALGEIVKGHAGIYESDAADTASAKLEAILPEGEERPWLRARLLPLLGIDPGIAASQEESFAAWRRFLEGMASDGPAVIVFEDLHWGDEALLDFIAHLAEWAEGVPLLLLCTARPELYERRPGWAGGMRNATTINLAPLTDRETAELVSALLVDAVTADVEREILERSGGNPLYAEEFVRLLADRGAVVDGEDALPDTVQALIAARLDTLAPDRKSLLQDAAVLGKVFWAGALAEIGGREPAEVELALHELARKELVRPARRSSMEGEAEYVFWHLIVRDVAYSQIPRPERARRHRAAATWIERKAGERVEDLAEVLASHYLEALELAQAAGDQKQAGELAVPARRFLALAGVRALGLDAIQAEGRLTRALELWQPDEPERAELLVRWADALYQIGRLRDAGAAAEQALAASRDDGNTEGAARALLSRARIAFRLAEGGYVERTTEALGLLDEMEPGELLVEAHGQLAQAHFLAGSHEEAIAAAERALAVANQLALPVPARTLSYRGAARADLGDAEGIKEMQRALGLLIERGAGWDAATTMNNLAYARSALEGPTAMLEALEDGIDFCSRRGLGTVWIEGACPAVLFELGQIEQALEMAGRLAKSAEAIGDYHIAAELQMISVQHAAEAGGNADIDHVDALIDKALEAGALDTKVQHLAIGATALVRDAPEHAISLLTRLDQMPGATATPYYARFLPGAVRTAIAAGDLELGRRLANMLKPLYALHEHALCAARAQLAEAVRDHDEAATLYADAAERWQSFGNVPERAYALLGQGRCLVALERPGAEPPLARAQELFGSLGYELALAETDKLLCGLPGRRIGLSTERQPAGDTVAIEPT